MVMMKKKINMGKKDKKGLKMKWAEVYKSLSLQNEKGCLHSYSCAFDIRGTLEIFLPLKFERHVVPLNSPKFLQLIVFKVLLHLRGFTVVTLKY